MTNYNFNITLNYHVDEEKKAEKPKKESLDLEDEEEEKNDAPSSKSFINKTNLDIDVTRFINKPQEYKLNINAKINNRSNSYEFKYLFKVNSFSKVKINYLKMSVSNTSEKNDQKENTIEYPKRSFKNIKATQKSVIRLKVNVSRFFLFLIF